MRDERERDCTELNDRQFKMKWENTSTGISVNLPNVSTFFPLTEIFKKLMKEK